MRDEKFVQSLAEHGLTISNPLSPSYSGVLYWGMWPERCLSLKVAELLVQLPWNVFVENVPRS